MQLDHPYLYQPKNQVFPQLDRVRQRDADDRGAMEDTEPDIAPPPALSSSALRGRGGGSGVRPASSYSGRRQFGLAFWGVLLVSIVVFFFVVGIVVPMGGSMAGY